MSELREKLIDAAEKAISEASRPVTSWRETAEAAVDAVLLTALGIAVAEYGRSVSGVDPAPKATVRPDGGAYRTGTVCGHCGTPDDMRCPFGAGWGSCPRQQKSPYVNT